MKKGKYIWRFLENMYARYLGSSRFCVLSVRHNSQMCLPWVMRRLIVTLLMLLTLAPRVGAADISAFVDRTTIAPGESIQLTVTSSGGEASVDISPIRDFNVVSSATSSNIQIVNGRMSRNLSYTYTLIPRKTGHLVIPRLAVVADGKTHHTKEIRVSVSRQRQRKGSINALFVEAVLSDRQPFEGEQIIYTFRLFHQVQISNARLQRPSFSGFTAKEIEAAKSYRRIISGKQYDVSEVRYVLIPLSAGEKIIEPASLQCDVVKPRSKRRRSSFDSFFNDPFFGRRNLETRIFETKPIPVQVKPLPVDDGNIPFSGLVGEFNIAAQLENDTLNVGDSTTLSVIVEGTGNIMDAEEPILTVPDAFKLYNDSPEEDIQLTATGYSGKKVFRTALVPVKAGEYSLPPVRLSYLDSSTGEYRTESTRSLTLRVLPSEEKEELNIFTGPDTTTNRPALKKQVKLVGRDILPLSEDLDALNHREPLSLPLFLIMLIGPAVCYLTMRGVKAITRKDTDPAARMAERAAIALKGADPSRDDDEIFLTHLYRALVSTILSKAGVVGESLTYAEVEEILHARGYAGKIGKKAAELLAQIESAKFSGSVMDPTSKTQLYSETKTLIGELSK